VFLPGWEEDIFPNRRSLDENGQKALEEERRLAYVGITRARARVYVSFAANRRVYNQWQSSIPSRFIDELPKDAVEQESDAGLYGNTGGGSGGFGFSGFKDVSRAGAGFRQAPKMVEADAWESKPARESTNSFRVGDRVFHDKFGYGRVEAVDESKLDIAFDKSGRKKVLDSFVQPA
jgi:DNA helicase-2/ATP-dependent DNA helicase PcrA